MIHTNQKIIKHKVGLLNLAAESSYTNLIQQSLTTLQEAAEKLKEAKRKK